MALIKVTIVTAVQSILANGVGSTYAGIKVGLTAPNGVALATPITLTAAPYAGQFADIGEGDYVVAAVAIDSTGVALGAPVSTTITVAALVPGMLDVIIPVSLSLSQE